ncbi:diguanylate cyclase [Planococcus sp. CP5-4]|uniref:GGDEF domain-containing response regulator n=1 Tax=unclassified Planococcus (in: firmicutes) TaxID=2662419 RepID=UPI001C250EA0|nr:MULTISPECIES: diguanylate cyclase [unclassified Planococcus (in: firmicutes)]MBU9671820.1 diguanylate cyclase [Planococcus sp. CP5-4_YE]MBV0909140.1 diguanylate cyclase [Planococcus sp. CP5-4_UN]MBW6063632.1 diguanylate cyclase [Planococcus sp. CP5-4]
MAQTDYKALLANRMERDFSKWAAQGEIQEREVYRFLHTMKGTAGTIGLMGLSDFCTSQLDSFSENSTVLLPVNSLEGFMSSFRRYFTDEELEPEKESMPEAAKNYRTNVDEALVLIIDADAEAAAHLKEKLELKGITVVIALDAQKGTELFYTLHPQMVLLETKLPDIDGFALGERIVEAGRNRYLTVALMSEDDDVANHIRAMEIGATDFLSKPLTIPYLIPYMKNRLRNQEIILQGTRFDDLTGAGNRKGFEEVLQQMINLAERTGKTFTLVLLDLDYFKKINDNYGHPAGDKVLRMFSQLVLKLKRNADQFFRYGGEEFALILPETKAKEAILLIERLRTALAETVFEIDGHQPFSVTFSAGISEYRMKQQSLVNKADQALYQAKRNGRDQTNVYESEQYELKRKLNVLIVDDDSLVRKLVSKQFSNWKSEDFDIQIEEHSDGLALVDSDWYRPDENYMILLDGVMPKMDGLEVLSHVRSQYPHDNIVVSMLTSRNNESDIVLALKSGADDYIVKPFYAQEVVARVQRLTKRMFQ